MTSVEGGKAPAPDYLRSSVLQVMIGSHMWDGPSKARVCGLTAGFNLDIHDDVLNSQATAMDDLEAVLRGMQSASPRGSMQVALRTSQRRRLQAASEQASMMSMSDDMDSILRHPLFPRLKRAVLACQQVGLDDEEVWCRLRMMCTCSQHHQLPTAVRCMHRRRMQRGSPLKTAFVLLKAVTQTLRCSWCEQAEPSSATGRIQNPAWSRRGSQEHYCQLFEQLRAHVEDFDERLQSDMRVYYRELTDALAHATPRSDTCEASAHCSDADKAALRTRYEDTRETAVLAQLSLYLAQSRRHRQTITDVKRKIIQKQKKSRLPETAVASLKAWWEDNSGHPFPSVRRPFLAAVGAQITSDLLPALHAVGMCSAGGCEEDALSRGWLDARASQQLVHQQAKTVQTKGLLICSKGNDRDQTA